MDAVVLPAPGKGGGGRKKLQGGESVGHSSRLPTRTLGPPLERTAAGRHVTFAPGSAGRRPGIVSLCQVSDSRGAHTGGSEVHSASPVIGPFVVQCADWIRECSVWT